MLIFLQYKHNKVRQIILKIKKRHLKITGFFWPIFLVSKQDKLETLKKYWGIIYNRIQRCGTRTFHILSTYQNDILLPKTKTRQAFPHFTVHFYSFTAQSHVQSNYRVKVAIWNDVCLLNSPTWMLFFNMPEDIIVITSFFLSIIFAKYSIKFLNILISINIYSPQK